MDYRQVNITCHQCKTQNTYVVLEWPAKVFICVNCKGIYMFKSLSENGMAVWQLKGSL